MHSLSTGRRPATGGRRLARSCSGTSETRVEVSSAFLAGCAAAGALAYVRLRAEISELRLVAGWHSIIPVCMALMLSGGLGGLTADAISTLTDDGWSSAFLDTPLAWTLAGAAFPQLLGMLPIRILAGGRATGLPAWQTVWSYLRRRIREEASSARLDRVPDFALKVRKLGNTPQRFAARLTAELRGALDTKEAAVAVNQVNAVLQNHGIDKMERLVELAFKWQLRPFIRRLESEMKNDEPPSERSRRQRRR